MSGVIKSKCPHCLRSVELKQGKLVVHMNASGKVCTPKAGPVQASGNYSGYKKGS
ncbi:MAG TPA: hypothetical protein VLF16_06985 [Pseudomonas sp.]|nr:hypothetical protein [Pseudomonas sp.]